MMNAAERPTTTPVVGLADLVDLVSEQLDLHTRPHTRLHDRQLADPSRTGDVLQGERFTVTLSAGEGADAPVRSLRLEVRAADAAGALAETLRLATTWLAELGEATVTLQLSA